MLMFGILDISALMNKNPIVPAIILFCELIVLFWVAKWALYISRPKHKRGFQKIAGMKQIKEQIYQEVIFPYLHKTESKKFNLSLPNGILFYGPPGCGKTFFVECLAEELNIKFIKISHGDLAAHHIHETVEKISAVFKQARDQAPCLLFFDEIEGLLPSRDKIPASHAHKIEEINEFLLHLNNASKDKILVIGATNHIDKIDQSVQRSGRFDLKIYIPPPDAVARQSLFRHALKKIPHSPTIDYAELAKLTADYASSDIIAVIQSVSRYAAAHHAKEITQQMLIDKIREHPSSLKKEKKDNQKNFKST